MVWIPEGGYGGGGGGGGAWPGADPAIEQSIYDRIQAEIDRDKAAIDAERERIAIARGQAEAQEWYQKAQIALQEKQTALQALQFGAQLGGPSNYFQYLDYAAGGRQIEGLPNYLSGLKGIVPRAAWGAPGPESARPPVQSMATLAKSMRTGRPVGAETNAAGNPILYGRQGRRGAAEQAMALGLSGQPAPTQGYAAAGGSSYLANAAALADASPSNQYLASPAPAAPGQYRDPRLATAAIAGYGGGGEAAAQAAVPGAERLREGRRTPKPPPDPRQVAIQAIAKSYKPSYGRGYSQDDIVALETIRSIAGQGAHTMGNQAFEQMTQAERDLWASGMRKIGHDPADFFERYSRSRIGNMPGAVGLA